MNAIAWILVAVLVVLCRLWIRERADLARSRRRLGAVTEHKTAAPRVVRMVDADGRVWKWSGEVVDRA